MTAEEVVKYLVGTLGGAGAVIAFLFYRIEKAIGERDKARTDCETSCANLHAQHAIEVKTLHEAHKVELRENGKALVEISKQLFTALERVNDLAERRRQ